MHFVEKRYCHSWVKFHWVLFWDVKLTISQNVSWDPSVGTCGRYGMKKLSTLLALYRRIDRSPLEPPHKGQVMRAFVDLYVVGLRKLLKKIELSMIWDVTMLMWRHNATSHVTLQCSSVWRQCYGVNVMLYTCILITQFRCRSYTGLTQCRNYNDTWRRHDVETLCALLALCEGNQVISGLPPQRISDAWLWCFLWSQPEKIC